jgi:hypothetical protein
LHKDWFRRSKVNREDSQTQTQTAWRSHKPTLGKYTNKKDLSEIVFLRSSVFHGVDYIALINDGNFAIFTKFYGEVKVGPVLK